jgi:hypothetical protein
VATAIIICGVENIIRAVDVVVVMMNDDVDGLSIVWQCFGWSTSHDLKVA